MNWLRILTVLPAIACFVAAAKGGELLPPTKIIAGGNPIDVQRTAHSAPFVGDFDEDGIDDLMVGEFHEGRLRIFRNSGTHSAPLFDEPHWFTAAEKLGRVPTG